jgi:hypothetical protein
MGNALLADYGSASSHAAREPYVSVLTAHSCEIPTLPSFRLTSVLSMNAAISASVVLASRLSSNLHVFALILFAIQLFALYPILRRRPQVIILSSSLDSDILSTLYVVVIVNSSHLRHLQPCCTFGSSSSCSLQHRFRSCGRLARFHHICLSCRVGVGTKV